MYLISSIVLVVSIVIVSLHAFLDIPAKGWFSSSVTIEERNATLSNMTLRQYLSSPDGFHLAMAPSFFGFYAYFGALITLEEDLSPRISSVAGASAGAMAAILLSAGVPPRTGADFASSLRFKDFADPPGWFALFQGQRFEALMKDFLQNHSTLNLLEHSIIPVAVSSFDLRRMKGKVLTSGCMAKAARASATFPGLFQPTLWKENHTTSFLMDGGIVDPYGLLGLKSSTRKRIVNLAIGDFDYSYPYPIEPNEIQSLVSVSIVNTPKCGPSAMENGEKAVEAARIAMKHALDLPLYHGDKEHHYELRIDASPYS